MNVCGRAECQTTAGCAHRHPDGRLCYFPERGHYHDLPGWLSVDARPLRDFSDDEIAAEYHLRQARKHGGQVARITQGFREPLILED